MQKIDSYTKSIKRIIEDGIVETKRRDIQKENGKLYTYWNVGKEIVKAENEDKIKYGNSYIKNLSFELTKIYGNNYEYSALRRMKNFYLLFPNWDIVCPNFITWSHIRCILPLKEENKRNYYIKLVSDNNLSVRELKQQIKNNAYEKLDEKTKENIKLEEKTNTFDLIKDSLLLSIELTKLYSKGYDYSNLSKMKQFYLLFPNCAPLRHNFITWSHVKTIIPIKEKNKRKLS